MTGSVVCVRNGLFLINPLKIIVYTFNTGGQMLISYKVQLFFNPYLTQSLYSLDQYLTQSLYSLAQYLTQSLSLLDEYLTQSLYSLDQYLTQSLYSLD